MELNRVTLIYFSPTGGTRDTGRLIAGEFRLPIREIDITDDGAPIYREFSASELLIAAVPCFGGRVPHQAAMRLADIAGRSTPVIPIISFGNRNYGDSLRELGDILTGAGFVPVAALASARENSLIPEIGAGRPDENDIAELRAFAMKARTKVGGLNYAEAGRVKLGEDGGYCSPGVVPFAPACGLSCNLCGECVRHCPAGAIPKDDPRHTDGDKCIMCMRCVKLCPVGARYLSGFTKFMLKIGAGRSGASRKTNIFYL